jgi:hypothetical protein
MTVLVPREGFVLRDAKNTPILRFRKVETIPMNSETITITDYLPKTDFFQHQAEDFLATSCRMSLRGFTRRD